MNIASIDIGTNTALLLIAKINRKSKKMETILNEYRTPRLGKGLSKGKPILEESLNKLFVVLKEYKNLIKEYKCEEIIVTATNALRIASNAAQIKIDIKNGFGFNVNVVDGIEEARLSYLGASGNIKDGKENVVIDIGGGSTELIVGQKDNIVFRKSFDLGVVSLTEKYLSGSLISADDIAKVSAEIKQKLSEFAHSFSSPPNTIAVAGTPTTLSFMKLNLHQYSEEKVEGSTLTKKFLINKISEFTKLQPAEIKNKYGSIVQGREDLILAGTILLNEILSLLNTEETTVSGRGIRYGAIQNYIISLG